jgi:hypothetical protein
MFAQYSTHAKEHFPATSDNIERVSWVNVENRLFTVDHDFAA